MNRDELIDELSKLSRKKPIQRKDLLPIIERIQLEGVVDPHLNSYGLSKKDIAELMQFLKGYEPSDPNEILSYVYQQFLSPELHERLSNLEKEPGKVYQLYVRIKMLWESGEQPLTDALLDKFGLW